MESLRLPACGLGGWSLASSLLSEALGRAVCCCHPPAAAGFQVRLEIETACWAPESFPLLRCHSSGGPACAARVAGTSWERQRAAGSRAAWEFRGWPWPGHLGVTSLVVRACAGLRASKHPLSEQLLPEPWEGGKVMGHWPGRVAHRATCRLQLLPVDGLPKCMLS